MLKFLLLFLGICQIAAAQDDKVYYDNEWVKCDHKHASYYRVFTLQDSIYKVDDYYLFDKLYRTGYRTSITSESINCRVGHYVFYDSSGYKMREGDYENGKRSGDWVYYQRHSTDLRREEHYQLDSLVGYSYDYDSLSKKVVKKSDYTKSNIVKTWEYDGADSILTIKKTFSMVYEENEFYKNGKIKRVQTSQNGKVVSMQCFDEQGGKIACDTTKKTMPEDARASKKYDIGEYLAVSLKYPDSARENNITGKVIVRFTVDEDGTIADVRVLHGIGGGCDEEAMRVVTAMPPWKPGMLNGIPVRVYFTLPISFNLE